MAIAVLLVVPRRAPDRGYFADGDRAAGFFSVLSTSIAILIGFVVFLAFESFDHSRSGAEAEALAVVQQFETAQFLPARIRPALSGSSSATPASSWSRSGRGWRTGRPATR